MTSDRSIIALRVLVIIIAKLSRYIIGKENIDVMV